ncbi:MAG TPA: hypothetical protein PKZ97_07190 [Azospirillaceae bacterium]|nr:hypothetical protein [Azospirillaceae bacterium]HRQ80887.1 hypothetical protein [Azospirillaceae bacterium]
MRRRLLATVFLAAVMSASAVPGAVFAGDPLQVRQQTVAGALAAFHEQQKQVGKTWEELRAMLEAFNKSSPEQKLAEADKAIAAVRTLRRTIQPGSDLRLLLESFIASLNAHGERSLKSGLEDPAFALPRAEGYRKLARETADELARIDTVHAGLIPLETQLGQLRVTLAEDMLFMDAEATVAAIRAWVDRLEKAYRALASEIRGVAVPARAKTS